MLLRVVIALPILSCVIRAALYGVSIQFLFFLVISFVLILNLVIDFRQFDFGPLWNHWKETQHFDYSGNPNEEELKRSKNDNTSVIRNESLILWLLLLSAIFAFHPEGLSALNMRSCSRRDPQYSSP